jgi:hypothetical protein
VGLLAKLFIDLKIKTMKNKTLHLNLIRKWFSMIWELIKKEEYRVISPYFCSKFLLARGHHKTHSVWKGWMELDSNGCATNEEVERISDCLKDGRLSFKAFPSVTFSNGMTPPVPRFEIEFNGFEIREGKPEWGAEKGKQYFVLELGAIKKQNYE